MDDVGPGEQVPDALAAGVEQRAHEGGHAGEEVELDAPDEGTGEGVTGRDRAAVVTHRAQAGDEVTVNVKFPDDYGHPTLKGQDAVFETKVDGKTVRSPDAPGVLLPGAPDAKPTEDGQWVPGDAPSQASEWAVEMTKKAGQIGIIGVYSPQMTTYPIGKAMNKNLTVRMGNCNHRAIIPGLVDLVAAGVVDPTKVLTEHEHMDSAIEAYEAFDKRQPGWIKVELEPQAG